MSRRSYLRDLAPTDEELEAAKRAESAAQDGSTWGSAIGTGLGAVGGGLLGTFVAPGLGTAAGAGLGASIGGGLGSAIGGGIGGMQADEAEETLREGAEKRQEALEQEELYQQALKRFLETS
jgi:hypothetical protein